MEKYFITNAIPYVNAKPHIGHALEFIQSDTIARYHRLLGEDVCLLCGGDENALKNVQAAEAAGEDVQTFIDKNTQLFADLAKKLNVEFNVWQKAQPWFWCRNSFLFLFQFIFCQRFYCGIQSER